MIENLTPEQEKELQEYQEYCYQRGISTEPINREKIEENVTELFKLFNIEKPVFLYYQSIYECQIAMNILVNLEEIELDQLEKVIQEKLDKKEIPNELSFFTPYFLGQQDYYWIGFYKFCERLGIDYGENSRKLELWKELAEVAHWWWYADGIAIFSERPIKMLFNNQKQFHCDNGAALEYKDGYKQWYLNGTEVPDWLAETPADQLKAEDFKKISNTEVRSEFIRKFGIEQFEEEGKLIESANVEVNLMDENIINNVKFDNVKVIKKEVNYKLIDMSPLFPNLDYAPYLFMDNPSTGKRHAEGVDGSCKTVQDALNWRAGNLKIDWKPVILS